LISAALCGHDANDPYTFGTMSLAAIRPMWRKTGRRAEGDEAGVWFHSSPTYNNGFTYMVLRMAFDENRAGVPR